MNNGRSGRLELSWLRRRLDELLRPPGSGAGGQYSPRSQEVMVASYPRSGNTWLRFLITGALMDQPVSYDDVDLVIPDIYQTSLRRLRRRSAPLFTKTHEPFRSEYKLSAYIYRDPVEVCLSYYDYERQVRRLSDAVSVVEFAQSFVTGTVDRFGTWEAHVRSWIGARDTVNVAIESYDNLLIDPRPFLKRVLSLAGIQVDTSRLKRARQYASRHHLAWLEEQGQRPAGLSAARTDLLFIDPRHHARRGQHTINEIEQVRRLIHAQWGGTIERLWGRRSAGSS